MSFLDVTNKLTEFPPLEDAEKSDGYKFSFTKLMWWKKSGAPSGANSMPPQNESKESSSPEAEEVREMLDDDERSLGRKRSPIPPTIRSDSNLSNRSNPSPDLLLDGSISPFNFEARTLPNVLRRIANLIAMGTNNQTDIKKYWMPDSVSKECYECAEKFTTFRRKHHCRICGQIFCSRCCNQEIPGKIIGYSGDLRVCTYCCKIVLQYLQSADLSSDLTDDLRTVQEDLQIRFGGGTSSPDNSLLHTPNSSSAYLEPPTSYRSLPRRKHSVGYQEERFAASSHNLRNQDSSFDYGNIEEKQKSILDDLINLKSLWEEMCHPVSGIDWVTHRHNMMRNFHHCAVGSELVDWLLAQRKITWRGQGIQIGQMLIDANLIEAVSQTEQIFLDAYALYKPIQLPLSTLQESTEEVFQSPKGSFIIDYGDGHDPLWVKQIESIEEEEEENNVSTTKENSPDSNTRISSAASLYSLDMNVNDSIVSISKPKEDELTETLSLTSTSTQSKSIQQQQQQQPQYPSNEMKKPIITQKLNNNNNKKAASTNNMTNEVMSDDFLQKIFSTNKKGTDLVAPMGWYSPQQLKSDTEILSFQRLCNAFIRHENDLLNHLLENYNLNPNWADVILPIVHKITEIVRPDVRHADDDMDIRQYVQFKKVPGGKREDSRIINGVACSKNVAHRSMRTRLKAPKILLIGNSIDYQRFENRFMSLEPLFLQEFDYLRNVVARISALSPDLVLIEKTVSRLAQELLLDQGITFAINVKGQVMERVARSTQAVIINSAEYQLGKPQLGFCHNFYIESFKVAEGVSKTLMFFDGCAMHLGCTVILRGACHSELIKVKKIMSFLVYIAYNWRLERSFHIDSFSMPPNSNEKKEKPLMVLDSPESGEKKVNKEDEEDKFYMASEDTEGEGDEIQNNSDDGSIKEPLKHNIKSERLEDHSDPLHLYLDNAVPIPPENINEKIIVEYETETITKYSMKKCLDEIILSASPFIKFSLPYLETLEGKSCELRKYFADEIYYSPSFLKSQNGIIQNLPMDQFDSCKNAIADSPNLYWKPPHLFTDIKITQEIESEEFQSMVADFRRKGNRLDFTSQSQYKLDGPCKRVRSNASSWNTVENEKFARENNYHGRIDALDPFKHQKLAVLFCSYSLVSNNAPYFCVNPWVVNMDMYGRNDITIGMFLERYCFRKTYLCPARQCETSMIGHIRRFAHEDGRVEVRLKEFDAPLLGKTENILMWSWCKYCKIVSPIVPMSVDAWSLSFAKYLDLRFHGFIYKRRAQNDSKCGHTLHHDHIQYFAQRPIVASFEYSKVRIWEIKLPPEIIQNKIEPRTIQQLVELIKVVALTGHNVYSNILEVICSLRETSNGMRIEEVIASMLDQLKAERAVFRSKIEDIQSNLTSNLELDPIKTESFLWKITDSINFLKSNISEAIQNWNKNLQEIVILRKKEEKQARNSYKTDPEIKSHLKGDHNDPNTSANKDTSSIKDLEESYRSASESAGDFTSLAGHSLEVPPSPNAINSDDNNKYSNISGSVSPNISQKSINNDKVQSHERTKSEGSEKIFKNPEEEDAFDGNNKKQIVSSSSSAVKSIISQFLTGSAYGSVIQSPWPSTEHHFQANLSTIPVTVHENEPSSIVAFALGSNEYKSKIMDIMRKNNCLNPSLKSYDDDETSFKRQKFGYELNSEETASVKSEMVYGSDKVNVDEVDTPEEKERIKEENQPHVEVQFSSSTSKFYCRIYFADQFRKLRKMCMSQGEDFFIRSISRCFPWAASGGKSGSTFCKTYDDRFVIKQMNTFEIKSFLNFAQNYFDYIGNCYGPEKKPTVLAKIIGVYRLGFKNSQTNSASKMDILIIENLFFERNILKKFDLKGSIRNRLVNTLGKEQEDIVLLDENLVNMSCQNPLYIRPHTKTILAMALNNDSRFLSSQMVMDYSLLVGLDEHSNELVVGIIDYIRTFTWDKKLETLVKSSGILGGQGKMPTVVSPEEYQTRFCEAMDRYFLIIPDRWVGLGFGVDS